MSKNLVIVESPAKCKTIEKYLGKDYKVIASYGHVRDLIRKDGAVDTENGYGLKFELIERNEKHVAKIIKALKKADTLYLATDQDREGEAISWHLDEILKERGLLEDKAVHRIVFNEITKSAIQKALSNPRNVMQPLVDGYLARRILDYLVGFNLSPLLWKKITPGLSAGRVQSPALRMIVEREKEIEAFNPREYWSIEATLEASSIGFGSRLVEYKGNKVEQFSFENEAAAFSVRETVVIAADGKLRVKAVNKKQRRRNPAPPFSTSTLQQDASRKLGFNARRTMMTAQKLYEGMDTGEGPVGLITYMRTDSVSLSGEAVVEIRELIAERYGNKNLPVEPNVYKSKSKNAQEAHEGVRPTSIMRTPEQVKGFLNDDQFKLYSLIWKRTVACQMVAAVFDTVAINMAPANDESTAVIRANGSVLVEPGFIAVYQEGTDDVKDDEADKSLPSVEVDELVTLNEIQANQHFTEPPPRYSEASLVKTLEEYGIGRPSTYANIISTLVTREYVEMDGKRFMATDRGMIVGDFLIKHFNQYVDYGFTAEFEDFLDEIARDENNYQAVLDNFWVPFKKLVDEKENLTREEVAQSRDLGTDPESGKPVSVRLGQYGAFAQIGTKDDEDKPKFAGLRPGQKIKTITFDEAMHLFVLPRTLGETPEGETVTASVGRFGPYVKYDQKFVSTKDEDPYTIDLETALRFIVDKKEFEANRIIQDFPDHEIQVLNGRFGPYISSVDKKNVKVPKDREPTSMTQAECIALVEKAAFKPKKKVKKKAAKKKAAKKKAAKKKAVKKKAVKKKTARKATKKKAARKATASDS